MKKKQNTLLVNKNEGFPSPQNYSIIVIKANFGTLFSNIFS